MKQIKYILFLLLIFLAACDSDNKNGEVAPAELIESIQAGVRSDNALRVDIKINFRQEVDYTIEYWKSDDESLRKSTDAVHAEGTTTSTLVFLEPSTEYTFQVTAVAQSSKTVSDTYTFTTQSLPSSVPLYSMHQNNTNEVIPGYVMQIRMDKPGYITVMNNEGTVVWYENMQKAVKVANFDPQTNTFCTILGDHPLKEYTGDWIVVMDIFGNTILSRESGELFPHHEIRRLPNGDLIVVNFVPKTYDLTMWGGTDEETVWGDGYTIMDIAGNIKSQWDCFVEIDPREDPKIMDMVEITSVLENPIWYKDDWVHANSVNFDEEGNYYMTFNWLNQLWKINKNTGLVEYRAGINGNIEMAEEAYTSGIHTAMPISPDKVLLVDNGARRQITRALIYEVNKADKKAELTMNISLPVQLSSPYMSSVQIIGDDLLMFGSTFPCAVVYTDFDGNILRTITGHHQSYRAEYISDIKY